MRGDIHVENPIGTKEFVSTVKNLKKATASGWDTIPVIVLENLTALAYEILTLLYNCLLVHGHYP